MRHIILYLLISILIYSFQRRWRKHAPHRCEETTYQARDLRGEGGGQDQGAIYSGEARHGRNAVIEAGPSRRGG